MGGGKVMGMMKEERGIRIQEKEGGRDGMRNEWVKAGNETRHRKRGAEGAYGPLTFWRGCPLLLPLTFHAFQCHRE